MMILEITRTNKQKKQHVIRPHTDPSKEDRFQFWIEYSSIGKFTFCWGTSGGDANNDARFF